MAAAKTLAPKRHWAGARGQYSLADLGGWRHGIRPQPRDYSYRMPRTARREALLSALSLKNRDGKIIVVDKLELEEAARRS